MIPKSNGTDQAGQQAGRDRGSGIEAEPIHARGDIQISSRGGLPLRTGDQVSLHVLKSLAPDKWAVGVHGKVLSASSRLDLEPGTTVRARVTISGKSILFTILPEGGDARTLRAPLMAGTPGAQAMDLAHMIASALLRSGQGVQEEIVEKLRTLLAKTPLKKERAARAFAEMLGKGIDVTSQGSEKIAQAMAFGEQGGRDRGRYKQRPFPEDAEGVSEAIRAMSAKDPSQADVLAAFNHMKSTNQSWVVLPFFFRHGEDEYPGTMKILFDPFTRKPLRFALSVSPNGGEDLSFYLRLEGKKTMSLFASKGIRPAAEGSLWRFASKLHNMGIEVDDIINGEESFDGFCPTWEGAIVKRIDTVG
jgi:hypothetical protein